jgi:hypothetical protein
MARSMNVNAAQSVLDWENCTGRCAEGDFEVVET